MILAEDTLTFFISHLMSFENFENICLTIHIAILARSFDRISREIRKWNKKKNKEKGKTMKKSRKNGRWKLIITQKKKMHATLKLNKFHSPAFAGQQDIQFQRLQWLYPQKKFLLRSTSRYTYVLCIVSKCWCSCERGILVWRERESHPKNEEHSAIFTITYLHQVLTISRWCMRLYAAWIKHRISA